MNRIAHIACAILILFALTACVDFDLAEEDGAEASTPSAGAVDSPDSEEDDLIAQLYETQQSKIQVSGSGNVIRLLDDDVKGDRHQRFILELASGQTLLVAHNIDIAPRLDGLAVGDEVEFYGEYIYSKEGGTIHWTHHDSNGSHVSGWLKWAGKEYK